MTDLTSYLMNVEIFGEKLAPDPRPRHDHPVAHRWDRHDMERHRVDAVAPRQHSRRSPPLA